MIHKLPDGRDLAYAEYGDLGGTPVFFFHGAPGTRLFHPYDDVTKRLGVRLIGVDRPGYGNSTFQAHRRILDWPKDVASLGDALHLNTFAILGHSGGGPHTLACAYALPERVTAAAVVSGAGAVDAPSLTEGLTARYRFGFRFGQYIPWLVWRAIVGWLYREIAADPTRFIDREKDTRPQADSAILDIPEIRELCIQSDVEAFRHGLLAYAWDTQLLTHPWGFPLDKIKVPIHLWHGTADSTASVATARYLGNQIPNCRLTICEGEAHMLLIPHWEEILTDLIRMSVST